MISSESKNLRKYFIVNILILLSSLDYTVWIAAVKGLILYTNKIYYNTDEFRNRTQKWQI